MYNRISKTQHLLKIANPSCAPVSGKVRHRWGERGVQKPKPVPRATGILPKKMVLGEGGLLRSRSRTRCLMKTKGERNDSA